MNLVSLELRNWRADNFVTFSLWGLEAEMPVKITIKGTVY